MNIIQTIRAKLKCIMKRISLAANSVAVAACALQASGVLAMQPAALQLKATIGIIALNMLTHHIKHPAEVEAAKSDTTPCCKAP